MLKRPVAPSVAVPKVAPSVAVSKAIGAAPKAIGAASKAIAATGKQPIKAQESRAGGFLLKPVDKKDEGFDGKFVIPKILLEGGPSKLPDSSARVMDTGAYEMLSAMEHLAPRPVEPKRSSPTSTIDGPCQVPSQVQPRGGADKLAPPRSRSDPRVRSKTPGRGGRPGDDSSDRKLRRREIRTLLARDEFGEPRCCPRTCLLLGLWVIAFLLVTMLLKFLLDVDLRMITMTEWDANACFMNVYLRKDGAGT